VVEFCAKPDDDARVAKFTNALIIDDEAHVRLFLKLVLAELGIAQTWEAANGQEGLDSVRAHRPELVLVDLNMPVMSGQKVLERLRAEYPETVVVVVTSQNTAEVVAEAQRLGASGFILKHAPRARVLAALREVLEECGEAEG